MAKRKKKLKAERKIKSHIIIKDENKTKGMQKRSKLFHSE